MWPVGLIGFDSGWTIGWPGVRPGSVARFSASVLPVTVRQSPSSKPFSSRIFITAGVPPTLCRSSMHVLAARLEVGEERHAVADRLEVVDRQRHADRAGHGDQVQHGVRRAAERHDDHHRVLERRARHDVARLDVVLEQIANRRARRDGIRRACRGSSAGVDELYGSDMPSASIAEAIVLAVYMPPQAPAPGQAWRTISLPLRLRRSCRRGTRRSTETPRRCRASRARRRSPARIVPP